MSHNANRSVVRAQAAVRAPGSSKCNIHRSQDVAFVCKDCGGDLLCPQCVKQHPRHNLVSVLDTNDNRTRTEYLQTFVIQVEKNTVLKLQQEIELTKKEKVENSKHFKNLVLKVEKRSEELKSWVDNMKLQYVKAFQKIEQNNSAKLEKYLSELNANLQLVGDCLERSKSTLQIGGPIQVYDTCTEIKSSDLSPPRVPRLESADFKENDTNQLINELRDLLGTFTGRISLSDQVSSDHDVSSSLSQEGNTTVCTPPATLDQTQSTGAGKNLPHSSGEEQQLVSGSTSHLKAPFMKSIRDQTQQRQQQSGLNNPHIRPDKGPFSDPSLPPRRK